MNAFRILWQKSTLSQSPEKNPIDSTKKKGHKLSEMLPKIQEIPEPSLIEVKIEYISEKSIQRSKWKNKFN